MAQAIAIGVSPDGSMGINPILGGTGQSAAAPPMGSREAILQPMHSFFDVWNTTGQTIALTYSFISSPPTVGSWVPVQNAALPGAVLQQAVRSAFQQFSDVIAVNFVELPPGSANQADIRIISGSYAGLWGYAQYYWSVEGSEKQLDSMAVIYAGTDFASPYGRNLVLHELGHTLTMKHSGNYDSSGAGPSGPFLPSAQDNGQYTIQSYNKHPFLNQERESLGLYDVAALQYRWGTNLATRSDDTIYSSLDGKNALTIWDTGGTDVLDFHARFNDLVLDLRDGAFSTIAVTNDLAIAYGVVIENAIGGRGHDRLTGNAADNRLTGGPGNDVIDGGFGIDTAVFSGPRSQNIVQVHRDLSGGVISVIVSGNDGVDSLTNIEWLEFSDGRFEVRNINNDDSSSPGSTDIFRFFNAASGTHFYTASTTERDYVLSGAAGPTFSFEGKVFSAPETGVSVWRFFNEKVGNHFYTANTQERDQIRATLDYMKFEGEAYKASDSDGDGLMPLYRFYNTATGAHFFTADGAEMTAVRTNLPQYQYEGIAYYIM